MFSGYNTKQFYKWVEDYGCEEDFVYVKDHRTGKAKRQKIWTFNGEKENLVRLHKKIYPSCGGRITVKELGKKFPDQQLVAVPYSMDNSSKINRIYAELETDVSELSRKEKKSKDILVLLSFARQKVELLKVPTIIELADEYLEAGKSIAIFVNFRKTLFHLSKEMDIDCLIHGGLVRQKGDAERQKAMQDFQADRKRIIILTGGAGGESISLHDLHGNYPRVGLISPSWNASEFVQILGRLRRAGGKSKVLQRILYAADTVEVEVAKTVMKKADNIQAINDGDLCGKFAGYY
jgi:superfamily II DNA or RNA helicase